MAAASGLRARIAAGDFVFLVEIVPSLKIKPGDIEAFAADAATHPDIAAGSVTNNAGGLRAQDPIAIAGLVRQAGLEPMVHLTCVNKDRAGLEADLARLAALQVPNVFAMTGDYPREAPADAPPVFDLDSVQLVRLVKAFAPRRPFYTAVAVNPFKYTEAELMLQYIKLEKKAAAGADFAITQLGYDARKFAELHRYVVERQLGLPLIGCVFILNATMAEKLHRGHLPGLALSQSLFERIREEARAEDGGRGARIERAARLVAVLRGIGYRGAYLGGTRRIEDVAWIIQRSAQLARGWERCLADVDLGMPGGYYLYGGDAGRRFVLARGYRIRVGLLERLGRWFAPTPGKLFPKILAALLTLIDRLKPARGLLFTVEQAIKVPAFQCRECGNCVLSYMEYVCPTTCPKEMRNGACGGSTDGWCEVERKRCIWIDVYESARAGGRLDILRTYVPPPDRTLKGTSSWVNYFLGRDVRPAPACAAVGAAGRPGDPIPLSGPAPSRRR